MSVERGQIGRFVRAARTLLLAQLAAAVIALAFAVWAVAAVSDLAAERDRLREQLAARPAGPAAAAPGPLDLPPGENVGNAPVVVPIAVPIPEAPADTNMILPGDPPLEGQVPPPEPEPTPPDQDCIGANADQARCRPGRWTRPPTARPPTVRPPAETPPGNDQQPRGGN